MVRVNRPNVAEKGRGGIGGVERMSRDELRQLALAFRAIDRVINSRGVRLNTVKNRAKRMRRKGKQAV